MQIDQLKPNVIVTGSIFGEPVQVLIVTPMGESIKLIGQGLNTNQVHQLILNASQITQLQATPGSTTEGERKDKPKKDKTTITVVMPTELLNDIDAAVNLEKPKLNRTVGKTEKPDPTPQSASP